MPARSRTPTLSASIDPLIPFAEVAALVGVQTRTLHKWVAANLFPRPMRLGKKGKVTLRYRKSDLDAYFAQEASHANRPAPGKGATP